MTTHERVQMDALGEFWNALNLGAPELPPTDADPEMMVAVLGLHRLDDTLAPDPSFVKRLEKQLMNSHVSALSENGQNFLRLPVAAGPVPWNSAPQSRLPTGSTHWPWRGALVTLVLLALAGGLVGAGRPFQFKLSDQLGLVLPALELSVEPSLAFEREITGGEAPLVQPAGMALSEDGRLFVVDEANDNVRVFDAEGEPIATWGESGGGPGDFLFSLAGWGDLAIAPDGRIVVLDPARNEIQEFTPSGSWLRTWGGLGSGPGQFLDPNSIAIDHDGLVYVTDYTNHRVQVFDESGKFRAEWNGATGGGTPLAGPTDVAIGVDGMVWVTDDILHRVFGFRPDGTVAVSFGGIGEEAGELHGPWGIAVDADGSLYVAEHGSDRIQVFAPDGTSLAIFSAPGSEPGQFPKPTYIAFGPDGSLYVADEGNHRLQEFQVVKSAS